MAPVKGMKTGIFRAPYLCTDGRGVLRQRPSCKNCYFWVFVARRDAHAVFDRL